jgi:membrane dipeptidase
MVKNADQISENAKEIHFSSTVVDAHCDTLWKAAFNDRDLGRRLPSFHADLKKLIAGGVNLQVFAAFVHPSQRFRGFALRAMKMISKLHETIDKYNEKIFPLLGPADIEEAEKGERIGALAALEGGHILEDSNVSLRDYYNAGVRLITLTWNNSNIFADGCFDKPRHDGLSAEGKELINEMNRLGIIVDVSHSSSQTLRDVLRQTKKPVIASHSCCRSLAETPRNLTDNEIIMIAENGGVIGINFSPYFLDNGYRKTCDKKEKERQKKLKQINRKLGYKNLAAAREKRLILKKLFASLPAVSYKRLVDHMEHIISLTGDDHLGLGSDFDGVMDLPEGMEDASRLPFLTHEMLARGWERARIEKILGQNILRIFRSALL